MNPKPSILEEFGQYLVQLRKLREKRLRDVEARLKELYTDPKEQKIFCICYSQLSKYERGEQIPSPMILRALARVYNENYQFMLYKAGYLTDNPLNPPGEWSLFMLRNMYFEKMCIEQKLRSLTESERELVEQTVENLILSIAGKRKK